jgi:hypothetical protein
VAAAVVRPLGDPKAAFIVVDKAGEPTLPTAHGCCFERLARDAGLPRIRLHDARHSAITVLLDQGYLSNS